MLDVKRLRVLKEVADRGSFSAAADALAYTQPAVSQQVAALEREAGTPLVERRARGIELTDAGRALVVHAEGILERLAAAEAELEAIAGLRGGRLRLASFPTAGATLVPLAIALFSERHPGVELSLVEAEPEVSLPRLRAGELDIALTVDWTAGPRPLRDAAYGGVDLEHLLDDPMYLAVHPDHPLAKRARVRIEDLTDEVWVQGDPGGLCGAAHLAACEGAGFEPRVGFQSDDYNVVQGLVAAGVAVSLIPELALTNLREDLVIRALDRRAPVRRVMAATRTGAFRSAATSAMLDVLHEASARYRAGRADPLARAS